MGLRRMSGYSKVTDNKVKKMLKAMGVSMRTIPVTLRKCTSIPPYAHTNSLTFRPCC